MTDFIDFKTLERPKSPNTHLLAPEDLCEHAEADQPSPHIAATPEAVYAACIAAIDAQKGWKIAHSDAGAGRIHFISTSALMRYKDDVDVLILPNSAEATQLAIYSRSRVGYSDMGANAKRVATLLAAIEGLSRSG